MKRKKRYILASVLLLIVGGSLYLARGPLLYKPLEKVIEKKVAEIIGIDAKITEVSGDLLTGIKLSDVEIVDIVDLPPGSTLRFESLEVSYDSVALALGREGWLERIDLVRPEARIDLRGEARRVPRLAREADREKAEALSVPDVSVRDGQVKLILTMGEIDFLGLDLEIESSGAVFAGTLRAAEIRLRSQGSTRSLHGLRIAFISDGSSVEINDLFVEDLPYRFRAAIDLTRGKEKLLSFLLAGLGGGTLEGEVRWDEGPPSYSARLRVPRFDLGPLLGFVLGTGSAAGTLEAKGSIRGVGRRLEGDLSFGVAASRADLSATASGSVEFHESELILDEIRLTVPEGSVRLRGQIARPFDSPRFSGQIDFAGGVPGRIPPFDGRAVLGFAEGVLAFEEARIRSGRSDIRLNGSLRWEEEVTFLCHFSGVAEAFSDWWPWFGEGSAPVDGRISMEGAVAGTPSRPGGWASLRLEAGRLGKLPLDELVAHLRYEEGRLSLDGLEAKLQGGRGGASLAGQAEWFPAGAVVGQFRHLDLRWDDATLSASSPLEFRSERGAVDIGEWVFDSSSGPMRLGGARSADGTIDLSVDAPRVDLEPTLRLFGMEDPPTGEVGISGRLTAGAGPLSLEADAKFRGIAWQGISVTSGEVKVAVDGERINIHTARLRGVAGGEIWARGEIPLGNPSEPIRLLLDARDLDLTRLLDPIKSIRLPKGTLRAQLLATGTWDDPYLHGTIRVDDGAARFPRPVPALEGFSGTIRFGGRRHQLEAVALLGNEKAKLSGEVVTKGLEPESIDFTIQGKNLLIAHSRDLRARSDVDLRLHGIPGELVLSGDVHLRRARYYRDLEQGGEGPGAGPGDEGALAGVAPILLDVRIDSEDDVWIDNRESLSQFRLEIQLEGTTRNPGVRGVVSCLGGKYRYYGRTFRINSALVDFDEEDLENPRVDIAATTRVAGVDIFLVVRGRLKSPQIDLASDPPYPDADILSLLSLGYTREGAVGAGGVSLAFTQAAHWLVGFIGEIFRTRDREVTFVDRITVEGSLGEGIESSQLKVIYEVTDQVAVQSERDEYGYFNFDVFFLRLRF